MLPVSGARAAPATGRRLRWLAGDHHVHTKYSFDGRYRVDQQVDAALAHGLDWLVITDHGGRQHQRTGLKRGLADLRRCRDDHPDLLLFQGVEWNVPAGQHATVFVAPGDGEFEVLSQFESMYDARVNDLRAVDTANREQALRAVQWLGRQAADGRTPMALSIVNHPGEAGAYPPSTLRKLRDADPGVLIGMEGAPGHQAAGIPESRGGAGRGRGAYDGEPWGGSFRDYPKQAYRTFGGFDWMTATVGGVWDAMLAEGLPFWIVAGSDSHAVFGQSWRRGEPTADEPFPDPVMGKRAGDGQGDFWPGQFARTHVGAASADYVELMRGLRAGRIWVDHGQLVDTVDVSVGGDRGAHRGGLGEVVTVRRGETVEATVTIDLRRERNHHGDQPRLRRVDIIAGPVTGQPGDRDAMAAPDTAVAGSYEISQRTGTVTVTHDFRAVDSSFYLRVRGTNGEHHASGSIEPRQDPKGDADPWDDLWFYTNPVFVQVD
ncbi:histidinol-phosphatase [Catellatospora sp. TT07R-123]|nr:histidinol-phosphatase [Catellatospora sp. TT07R-123]